MPISNITYQLDQGDEAAVSISRSGGLQPVGGGQEQYLVEFTDTPAEAASRKFIALDGIGWAGPTQIPPLYSGHYFNPWIFVVDKNAVPWGGPLTWMVTVIYETISNPLEIPPQVSWSSVSSIEQVDKVNILNPAKEPGEEVTLNQSPTNSSGEAVDPPITDDPDDLIYRTVFNQEFFNHTFAREIIGSLNSEVWKQFEPTKAKLKIYSAVERRAGPLEYVEVTAEVHIRDSNWFQKRPDEGFRTIKETSPGVPELDADGAKQYETITDAEGKDLSQPTLLDGLGHKLAAGADPVIIEYNARKSFDFNLLGFA